MDGVMEGVWVTLFFFVLFWSVRRRGVQRLLCLPSLSTLLTIATLSLSLSLSL